MHRRISLATAISLVALFFSLGGVASATARLPAGRALTDDPVTVAHHLAGERHIWMWEDYWACTFSLDASGAPVSSCSWVPSRWVWVPAGVRCMVVPVSSDASYPVTVCGITGRN